MPNVRKSKEVTDKEILDDVVKTLLDENVPASVETTYRRDIVGKDGIAEATELVKEPNIPTEFGKLRNNGMSSNAYHARSVRVGKITITKHKNGGAFFFRLPDGRETKIISHIYGADRTALHIWFAALYKSDKNFSEMKWHLKEAGYTDLEMKKGTKKSKLDAAKEQLESLGLKESQMKRIMAKKAIEKD